MEEIITVRDVTCNTMFLTLDMSCMCACLFGCVFVCTCVRACVRACVQGSRFVSIYDTIGTYWNRVDFTRFRVT